MSSGKQVLIIDDEPSLRQVLSYEFQLEGYTVHEAADGREALKILEDQPGIDLVLTDVRMPRSDGFDFLKSLDQLQTPRPQTFIMTGDLALTREKAQRLGADGVIIKPFDWETLWSTIGKSVDSPSPSTH